MQISFKTPSGTPQFIKRALRQAANAWSSKIKDNVNVQVNIGFEDLGKGVNASAAANKRSVSYKTVRNHLIKDETSARDRLANGRLASGNSVPLVINHTAENGGSAKPYLDNNGSRNNSRVLVNTANANAIGLTVDKMVTDGLIRFNTNDAVKWDFNRDDGITRGATDFVGTAIHEIGHILGFTSQADTLDRVAATGRDRSISENAYSPTTLDLFRNSRDSYVLGAIDISADRRRKFLPVSGSMFGPSFSTGRFLGNGQQASHWNQSYIGVMGPVQVGSRPRNPTASDFSALDVVGWDLA